LRARKIPINIAEEMLIGAALLDQPTLLRIGIVIQEYDAYAIDYLESYVSKSLIIDYLFDKFIPQSVTEVQIMIICEYLLNHLEDILPFRKVELKDKLIEYINNKMDTRYQNSVLKLMGVLEVGIENLSREKLINAIAIEEDTLKQNYASQILEDREFVKTANGQKYKTDLLDELFRDSKEIFLKLKIAELLIAHDPLFSDAFKFIASYLLRDDANELPYHFIFGIKPMLYTASFDCINEVEELLIYSLQKESDRRVAIRNISTESYLQISTKISCIEKQEVIIESLTRVIHKTGVSYFYKIIDEIKTKFCEKYKIPTIEWQKIQKIT